MESSTPRYRTTVVSLAICGLLVGFVLVGAGCPRPPVCECTADTDCDDGLFCNGAETCDGCDCQAGTAPCPADECNEDNDVCAVAGCQSDADCAEGEFCDTQTGACVTNENLYATVTFDHDMHSGSFGCESCHHDGAGLATCDTCHNRDEVVSGIPVLKDVQHDPDGGCWQCHNQQNDDGTRDCSFCHTDLE